MSTCLESQTLPIHAGISEEIPASSSLPVLLDAVRPVGGVAAGQGSCPETPVGSRTNSHKVQFLLSCEQQMLKALIHSPSWILTSAAEKVTFLLALITPAKIVIRASKLITGG